MSDRSNCVTTEIVCFPSRSATLSSTSRPIIIIMNDVIKKTKKRGRKRVKIIAAFIIVHSPTWEENVQRRWKFRRDGAWIVLFGSREIRTAEMIFHPFQFNWKVTHTHTKTTQKSITPVIFFNKWITKQGPFLDCEMGDKIQNKRGRALDDFVFLPPPANTAPLLYI